MVSRNEPIAAPNTETLGKTLMNQSNPQARLWWAMNRRVNGYSFDRLNLPLIEVQEIDAEEVSL